MYNAGTQEGKRSEQALMLERIRLIYTNLGLQQHSARIFNEVLDLDQKLYSLSAIQKSMIVC